MDDLEKYTEMSKLKIEIISKAIARYEKRLEKVKKELESDPNIEIGELLIECHKELSKEPLSFEKRLEILKNAEQKKQVPAKRAKSWNLHKLIDQEIRIEDDLQELYSWLEIIKIREGVDA